MSFSSGNKGIGVVSAAYQSFFCERETRVRRKCVEYQRGGKEGEVPRRVQVFFLSSLSSSLAVTHVPARRTYLLVATEPFPLKI